MDELYEAGTMVSVIEDGDLTGEYGLAIGSEVLIIEVDEDDDILPYCVRVDVSTHPWVSGEEVGLLRVTYLGGE